MSCRAGCSRRTVGTRPTTPLPDPGPPPHVLVAAGDGEDVLLDLAPENITCSPR
ncbi:hypothetical protein HMPREF0682_2093 [Propionibacterium acidifaciens F0233]|uniref:Uncharacterized protein n=1 Tax=Propionibacterium acidifaciens F0233 TaxID=553198 RepID=U2QCR4_9ACTN|nr:hypothetical protein HMPREF0682_2093 [Propionibacterium acidifaciens F0233]